MAKRTKGDEIDTSVDLAQLKTEVRAISRAVKQIRSTGISEDALVLLIQHSAGFVGSKRVSRKMILAVIDGMEGLSEYVFPPE